VDKKNRHKTKRILEYFNSNPNKEFSPKDVSQTLGFGPKLVASILGRLVTQGLLVKTARGKYMHKLSVSYDYKTIIDDVRAVLTNSFGSDVLRRMEIDKDYEDLSSFLDILREKFGLKMAKGLLRHAVLKNYKGKKANAILNQLDL